MEKDHCCFLAEISIAAHSSKENDKDTGQWFTASVCTKGTGKTIGGMGKGCSEKKTSPFTKGIGKTTKGTATDATIVVFRMCPTKVCS